MFGPSKAILAEIEAKLGRLLVAADSVEGAARRVTDDGPDRSMEDIFANIRAAIMGGPPPPDTPERAASRVATAVATIAAAMDERHLLAFLEAARTGAVPVAFADTFTLLLLVSGTAPCRVLVEAYPEALPAALERIATTETLALSDLSALHRALAAFHDGTAHRPFAADVVRIAGAIPDAGRRKALLARLRLALGPRGAALADADFQADGQEEPGP